MRYIDELREGLGSIAVRVADDPVMVTCCRLIDDILAALRATTGEEPNIGVGVDVTAEGAHVTVAHRVGPVDRIIYSELHAAPPAAEAAEAADSNDRTLRCRDCGKPYSEFPLDVVLPDDQWAIIHPEGEGGFLCAGCIVVRGQKFPHVTVAKLHFPDLTTAAPPAQPGRIVLWSRGVDPNWFFIAERSKRPDINDMPVYETLDPITSAAQPVGDDWTKRAARAATQIITDHFNNSGFEVPAVRGDGTTPGHLHWMALELAKGQMSSTKACRWLGYLQAGLVFCGLSTLEFEKERNLASSDGVAARSKP